jgi:hypothetical protein
MEAAQQRFVKTYFLAGLATIFLLGAVDVFAQRGGGPVRGGRDRGQPAIVIVDGAAIYEKANFDSPVMDYLERGKKVLISKRVYRGAGGLGAFYKIKIRRGIFGYVTDVDVQVDREAKNRVEDSRRKPPGQSGDVDDPLKINPDLENPEEGNPDGDGRGGIYLTRYLGLGLNQFGYAETIAKRKKSANTSLIAIKLSGPGKSMGGMPLDYEFSFTSKAPSFYGQSFSSSKGFLFLSHAMTIMPLKVFKEGMFFYGFGLVAKYSKFDVVIKENANKTPVDSQDLVAGLGGHFGYTHSFSQGKYAIRVDGKYYYEKESYLGYGASLQMKF